MPIAAKLSRKLHDVFGTEAAEAMVDWMQQVDANRAELRELNDLSFARFDSRLGERIAELKAEVHSEIGALRMEMQTGFADLRVEMQTGFARVDAALERQKTELTRWVLGFWLASLVTLVGALAALARLPRSG